MTEADDGWFDGQVWMGHKAFIWIKAANCVRCFKLSQQTQNICIIFVQRRPNVFDIGPTLYKCYVFNGMWRRTNGNYVSPLQRRGHIAVPPTAHAVCVSLWVCRRLNTPRSPNSGLMLAHRLRRWPNISQVLSYRGGGGGRVWCHTECDPPSEPSFGPKNPAGIVYATHAHHWPGNMSSTGDAGPTFNRQWIGVSLYSVDTPPLT